MVIDNSFLKKHLVDLVHSGVSLEGALATRVQTKNILLGKSVEVDYKTAKIIKNIVVAFRYIYTKGCGAYNVPKTLMQLHVILSDSVEDFNKESIYQGRLRDFPVSIGGTNYQPPVCTPDISYRRLMSLLSTVDGSVDSILIAYCYLMKYQFFANTNKRTAYTWANLALFQCNTGYFLYLPTKKEGMEKFKDYLLAFYENDRALDSFVSYLKRYYLKEA
jgi:conserved hypothetical protein